LKNGEPSSRRVHPFAHLRATVGSRGRPDDDAAREPGRQRLRLRAGTTSKPPLRRAQPLPALHQPPPPAQPPRALRRTGLPNCSSATVYTLSGARRIRVTVAVTELKLPSPMWRRTPGVEAVGERDGRGVEEAVAVSSDLRRRLSLAGGVGEGRRWIQPPRGRRRGRGSMVPRLRESSLAAANRAPPPRIEPRP
jgi:hypothetical protein